MPEDQTVDPTTDHEPGFPLNRIVAFLGPQIAIVAGFVATWLVEHLEFLHLDATGTTGAVINVITFVLTAALTWAGQHKWLDGWQKYEAVVNAPVHIEATVTAPELPELPTLPELPELPETDHLASTEPPNEAELALAYPEEPPVPEGAVGGKPGLQP